MAVEIRRYHMGRSGNHVTRYHMGRRGSHVTRDEVPHGEKGQPCC